MLQCSNKNKSIFKKAIIFAFLIVFLRSSYTYGAVPVYVVGGFLHGYINIGVGTKTGCPSNNGDKLLQDSGVQITDNSASSTNSASGPTFLLNEPPPPPGDTTGSNETGGTTGGTGSSANGVVPGMNFDEILWRFLCTFKDYQESFTFDYLNAKSEKDRIDLTNTLMDQMKSFELAKIEKAREDVNKLINDTVKEMKDQPLVLTDAGGSGNNNIIDKLQVGKVKEILRLKGIAVKAHLTTGINTSGGGDFISDKCVNGIIVLNNGHPECWIIKQSSRVIENLDDYLYEEGAQKARDVTMCLLAPWNHWPLGEYIDPLHPDESMVDWKFDNATSTQKTAIDDFIFGSQLGLCDSSQPFPYDTKRKSVINECSSQYICAVARRKADLRPDMFSPAFDTYKQKLCPSDRIKEDLKKQTLIDLTRKHSFIETMPPEIWYYGRSMYPNNDNSDWTAEKYKSILSDEPNGVPQNFVLNYQFCKFPKNGSGEDNSSSLCIPYDPSFSIGRCTFILENTIGSDYGADFGQYLGGSDANIFLNFLSPSKYESFRQADISKFFPSIPLSLQIKKKHNLYIEPKIEEDFGRADKNTLDGLKGMIKEVTSLVVSITKEKNTLKYGAGVGIKPLQYLFGWNVCEDANAVGSLDQGAGAALCSYNHALYNVCEYTNGACQGQGYYFFETEDIISPAIFLVDKIASSIQSEFQLAMMAWKSEPESPGFVKETTCPEPVCAKPDDFNCWEKKKPKEDEFYPELATKKDVRENKVLHEYCIFRARDNLTQTHIGDITIDPAERKIIQFPKILPAPWEDLGRYLNLKNGWGDFIDNYCVSLQDKDTCENLGYLKEGGYPFCKWYENKNIILSNSKDPNKRIPSGICRYEASRVLVYDTDNPQDVYRNIDKSVSSNPYQTGERSPGYVGQGQYLNRLYRETIQLYEKPMGQAILDWYEPQDVCIIKPQSGGSDNCTDTSKNPQCLWDTNMSICRLKTCEEINNLGDSDKQKACPLNPACVFTTDNKENKFCRHK